jgi:acyl-CoA reductase-like NAD-dependent aldehyde dehydrogenase
MDLTHLTYSHLPRKNSMLKEIVQYPLLVKGVKPAKFVEIKCPFNGEVIAAVGQADEKAIDTALTIAVETFEKTMRRMPAYERAEILYKASKMIMERQEDLAKTIALEGGKPIKDARVEVARAATTFSIAAGEATRLDGEQIPMDITRGNEGRIGIVVREPVGVVGAICPFNFPLNLVAHKVAPALAAGNTVVLKPSSQTPVASFKLAEILKEAGLPEGALQVIPCRGSLGNALVKDQRVAVLSFTGSPEVGWRMRKEIHAGTRIVLELGGNAGLIVHDDADLETAARAATRGGYGYAGQTCISVQRVYVQSKVYDKFMALFIPMVEALKVGDPLDDTTDVGPLIDESAVDKTVTWIEAAVKGGAKLVYGGERVGNLAVKPAILTDTKADMLVVCQEVFGPIVSVMKYETIDDAINAVNDSDFGLQAGVFTNNLEIAFKAARRIDVGGVMVNDAPTFRQDHMPYGGRKESGVGLEGVRYALHEMTQPKFICLNLPRL